MVRIFRKKITVISDNDNQARSSEFIGQNFLLRSGNETQSNDAPVLTLDDLGARFTNFGAVSATGESSAIALEADRTVLRNSFNGEISAEQIGVSVSGSQARVVNTGTIAGDLTAVDFANGAESSGRLVNVGEITSDSRAVNIGGDGVVIRNRGTIEGTGDQRNGTVYADATAEDFRIINTRHGEIDAGEGNLGAGISLQIGDESDEAVAARIVNRGSIDGRGDGVSTTGLAGDGIRLSAGAVGVSFEGRIINTGTISSESTVGATAAIRVADGVGFDGRIVNRQDGVIEGANNGLYFGEAAHDAIVLNRGTIQSDSRAVNIDGSGVELVNKGQILGTGDQRNGTVYSDGSAEGFAINNFADGVIDAGEGNNGAGVSLQIGDAAGDTVEAGISNRGIIQGRSETGASANQIGDGIRIFSGVADGETTFQGNITNSGTIDGRDGLAVGDGSVANAIDIRDVAFVGDIVNTGTLSADGDVVSVDSSDFVGNITNSGSVTSRVDGDGIEVGGPRFTGNVTNSGQISAAQEGIDLASSLAFTGDVVNAGTLRAGDEGIQLSSQVRLTGNLSNAGSIVADSNGIDIREDGNLTGNIENSGTVLAGADGIYVADGNGLRGQIVNTGSITATANGIAFAADAVLIGDVVNTGSIVAEGDAIVNAGRIRSDGDALTFAETSVLAGQVVNSGSILADSRAVNIDGTGVQLVNTGEILGTGDQRNGTVYANATAEDFVIINREAGVIDAGEGNNGAAISLQIGDVAGDTVAGSVINGGLLRGRGDAETGAVVGDGLRVFGGVEGAATTLAGDIVNSGTIETAAVAVADGIEVLDVRLEGSILNQGAVISQGDGIDLRGVTVTANIESSGTISSGGDGIRVTSNNGTGSVIEGNILTSGTIEAGGDGFDLDESSTLNGTFQNTGTISATSAGIELSAGATVNGTIVNIGDISAVNRGIEIQDIAGFNGEIVNLGTITGNSQNFIIGPNVGIDVSAISAAQAQVDLSVRNIGVINGDVNLGQGNDVFDTTGGVVNGRIFGNGGNDEITAFAEGITANGGAGDDLLTGGAGTDTFVFTASADADIVRNFTDGDDQLDVSFFFHSGEDALAAARQDGADTVIDLNVAEADTVRLVDFDIGLLDQSDFVFV